jgi:hypothetical protein
MGAGGIGDYSVRIKQADCNGRDSYFVTDPVVFLKKKY